MVRWASDRHVPRMHQQDTSSRALRFVRVSLASRPEPKRGRLLWTFVISLIVVWSLVMFSTTSPGGLIHMLLVIAGVGAAFGALRGLKLL